MVEKTNDFKNQIGLAGSIGRTIDRTLVQFGSTSEPKKASNWTNQWLNRQTKWNRNDSVQLRIWVFRLPMGHTHSQPNNIVAFMLLLFRCLAFPMWDRKSPIEKQPTFLYMHSLLFLHQRFKVSIVAPTCS